MHPMYSKPYIIKQKFSVPVDKTDVAGSWNKAGYRCDEFTDPPGREWNDFVHSVKNVNSHTTRWLYGYD
jgi:hypothetical protein